MKNPFNTLFGQLALMTVGLIVIVHLTSLVLVDRDRGQIDTGHAQRALLLAVQSQRDGAVTASQVSAALGVSVINADDAIPYGCPAPCQDTTGPFQNALRAKLPPGSAVVADPESGNVWVRYAGNPGWLKLESSMLPARRFISASAMMLVFAVILALIGAWHLQRPLHRLAIAAREFRLGHRAPVVPASGPREVKGLIDDFNQMVHELAQAEQERAVMLAGVAHDLRAPITRMQVRADLLPDEANRSGFLRDAESLSRIVTQFLDFARESADRSPPTSVDAHCRRHYGDSLEDDALVRLDLQAGDGFGLPLVDLDRILTNLIENALTYGEPPVEISTSRHNGHYTLTVRDHGGGIPGGQLERALQPFVRLDEARSGDAHCGLGLAIVRRLVRYNGGVFHADNAVDGGFVVSMTFPA
ncbi:MAG: Osmolarity sensor protein envZ (EC [uncultured Paraburkholderia sp.]|uniref:ATP-binding protein n=1 Tax=uncultured Paraburkholderia sp. TaxID=1822466 RepID=UPI002592B208|nr:ATP-binding protein [uncultured Paraburkholderia sp.]CAH2901893.1 MAG: Osmolarity sensor protein envZ (EC [uncultured Paraburkholderia sp.]CAH2935410.1 MAG: Osmolarity sensor protein envZ (EC [uncultured Paraburkholderia sp.]